jgi:metal-responsive CopG/Arc/MetJ family transcriptional regulator
MRASVTLSNIQIEALDALARRSGQSRTALIREAIDEYLARHYSSQIGESFGLWADRQTDGLDYQEQLRDGW